MEYRRKNIDRLDELISTVKRTDNIPTLPDIIGKISDLMNDDTVSIKSIGDLMTKDVSLSARILKVVNSPFYGFSQRIHSLNHAIVLLGANVLKSIIISATVFSVMKETMKGLWELSIFSAFAAKRIAVDLNSDKDRLILKETGKKYTVDEDLVFSAGILHDIGTVIISTTFKEDFQKIIKEIENTTTPMVDIEYKYLNTSHDQIGYLLAKEWNLPPGIFYSIKYHHNPSLAYDYKIESAIIYLADFITRAIGIDFTGKKYIEEIDEESLKILNVDINFIKKVIDEVYSFKNEIYLFN